MYLLCMQCFEVMKYLLSIDAFRGLEAGRYCLQNRGCFWLKFMTRKYRTWKFAIRIVLAWSRCRMAGRQPTATTWVFCKVLGFEKKWTILLTKWKHYFFMLFHRWKKSPVRPNQDYWIRAARFSKTSCKESCVVLRALIRLRKAGSVNENSRKQRNTAAADVA